MLANEISSDVVNAFITGNSNKDNLKDKLQLASRLHSLLQEVEKKYRGESFNHKYEDYKDVKLIDSGN